MKKLLYTTAVLWRLSETKHGKFWIITKSLIVNRFFLQPMSDEFDNDFEDDFDDDIEDEEDEEVEDD